MQGARLRRRCAHLRPLLDALCARASRERRPPDYGTRCRCSEGELRERSSGGRRLCRASWAPRAFQPPQACASDRAERAAPARTSAVSGVRPAFAHPASGGSASFQPRGPVRNATPPGVKPMARITSAASQRSIAGGTPPPMACSRRQPSQARSRQSHSQACSEARAVHVRATCAAPLRPARAIQQQRCAGGAMRLRVPRASNSGARCGHHVIRVSIAGHRHPSASREWARPVTSTGRIVTMLVCTWVATGC